MGGIMEFLQVIKKNVLKNVMGRLYIYETNSGNEIYGKLTVKPNILFDMIKNSTDGGL